MSKSFLQQVEEHMQGMNAIANALTGKEMSKAEGKTPRTDALRRVVEDRRQRQHWLMDTDVEEIFILARTLERELAAAIAELDVARAQVAEDAEVKEALFRQFQTASTERDTALAESARLREALRVVWAALNDKTPMNQVQWLEIDELLSLPKDGK